MLINLSNHPQEKWDLKQTNASLYFTHTEDIPFPNISPEADADDIAELADEYLEKCLAMFQDYHETAGDDAEDAVHIQGEFTFTYRMVRLLKEHGIRCVASTTNRIVKENPDGSRTYQFEFVRFREYR